jgi:hypothetical protein
MDDNTRYLEKWDSALVYLMEIDEIIRFVL